MNDLIFRQTAEAFEAAEKCSYEFIVGKNNRKSFVISSVNSEDFVHITGLEHLPSIKTKTQNSLILKKALYLKILRGEYKYSDLKEDDIKALTAPINGTFNSACQKEYTLKDRLARLLDISEILDNAYKGALFRWDNKKCRVILPNGNRRRVSIKCDYLLKVPSELNADENIYIFMVEENKNLIQKELHKLSVISVFPDCVDLARGQERPFTILEETRVNLREKSSQVLYTHPSYQKKKDELCAISSLN